MRGMLPFRGKMGPSRKRGELMDVFDEMFSPDFWNRGMSTDIQETDEAYLMEVELPGYEKEDIEIELKNNLLTIIAKKEESVEEEKQNYIHRERRQGSYQRCFTIDENVDPENIEAEFKNGVLNLKLPKKQKGEGERKTIDIK